MDEQFSYYFKKYCEYLKENEGKIKRKDQTLIDNIPVGKFINEMKRRYRYYLKVLDNSTNFDTINKTYKILHALEKGFNDVSEIKKYYQENEASLKIIKDRNLATDTYISYLTKLNGNKALYNQTTFFVSNVKYSLDKYFKEENDFYSEAISRVLENEILNEAEINRLECFNRILQAKCELGYRKLFNENETVLKYYQALLPKYLRHLEMNNGIITIRNKQIIKLEVDGSVVFQIELGDYCRSAANNLRKAEIIDDLDTVAGYNAILDAVTYKIADIKKSSNYSRKKINHEN